MSTVVEFAPPTGPVLSVAFDEAAEFRGLAIDGVGPVAATSVGSRSPGQRGMTIFDLLIPARQVMLQFFTQYASAAEYWEKRSRLARTLVPQPALGFGAPLELGRLRILRDGAAARETDAVARSTFMPIPRGTGKIGVDVEFLCPSPYWRETSDTVVTLEGTGGGVEFTDPIDDELPASGFEFPGNDVEQEVVNDGDVPAPMVIRLWGEATDVRLLNVTSGEVIEVTGAVIAGDYIEINTAFGKKEIVLVEADGTRTNVMDRLNLAKADFWHLLPGTNVVRFEANVNVSGRAELTWRQQYGGL